MIKLKFKRGQSPYNSKISTEEGVAEWATRLFSVAANERAIAGIDERIARGQELIDGDLYGGMYCDDEELAPYFNIVATKHSDFVDSVKDLQYQVRNKGWTMSPSPKQKVPYRVLRVQAEELENKVTPVYQQIISQYNIDPESKQAKRLLMELIRPYRDEMLSDIQRAAKEGVARADKELHDQLSEGGWPETRDDLYDSMGKHPYAVLKGPFLSWGPMNQWEDDKLQFGEKQRISAKNLDPDMLYISPDSKGTQDGKFVVETIPIGVSDLIKMKRQKDSFNVPSINKILKQYKDQDHYAWWNQMIDFNHHNVPMLIDQAPFVNKLRKNFQTLGLLIYGNWTGFELKNLGFSGQNINDEEDYQLELLTVGPYVLSANVNVYPDKRRPYHLCWFRKGSSWRNHKSIPDILAGLQKALQMSWEDLLSSAYASSQPITEIDVNKLHAEEVPEDFGPGSVVFTKDNGAGDKNYPAIRAYLEPTNLAAIQSAFMMIKSEASTLTGISEELTGASSRSSVNRTTGVYANAIAGALKKIRAITSNLDLAVKDMILMSYNWMMVYSDKDSIKWDTDVVTTGTDGVIEKEQLRTDLGIILQNLNIAHDKQLIPDEAMQQFLLMQMAEYGVEELSEFIGNPLDQSRTDSSVNSIISAQAATPLPRTDGRSAQVPSGQIQQPSLTRI